MNAGTFPVFEASAPPADPRALAVRILSEPRFRIAAQTPAAKPWWENAWQWISDRWQQLVDAIARSVHLGHAGVALGDILIVLVLGLVVAVTVRLLLQLTREYAQHGATVPIGPHQSAAELYALSVASAESGSYAAAIVLLFRATLTALDVRRVVADAPSRTVNEWRRDVRRRAPALASPFDVIARAFTAVAYADAPVGEEQWAAAHDAYARNFTRGSSDET